MHMINIYLFFYVFQYVVISLYKLKVTEKQCNVYLSVRFLSTNNNIFYLDNVELHVLILSTFTNHVVLVVF